MPIENIISLSFPDSLPDTSLNLNSHRPFATITQLA